MLRNSFSGHRRLPATSQQRSGGLYFLALNQYFIRDKTISAGQNADFGGFLRSKAGSAGRFSSSVIKCHRCRRRSVPARVLRNSFSGHRRRLATSQQRSGGLYFLALNQYFIQDKTIPAGQNADFDGFLRSKAVSAGRFSSSVIKCRSCLRRSVPARSGAAQFALRVLRNSLSGHRR